ncbi:hypothetical protein GCM10018793_68150 [Streptomyces sulfonofaciens]|uniref:Uncharacterized protein n=1 Tax=Streptomyces sulfonofaciens TaxID=68272 RepID=A0A919L8Z6_9ACTN|nr:hypothetical protein GCM10018793_68150 [Streptomyces sulfonofaciens]
MPRGAGVLAMSSSADRADHPTGGRTASSRTGLQPVLVMQPGPDTDPPGDSRGGQRGQAVAGGFGGQGAGEAGADALVAAVAGLDVGEDAAQGAGADLDPAAVGDADVAFQDFDPGPGV